MTAIAPSQAIRSKRESRAKQVSVVLLVAMITDIKNARDSKCIYISKTWAGKKAKIEKTVRFDDLEIISFLATMELDCLYRIDLN